MKSSFGGPVSLRHLWLGVAWLGFSLCAQNRTPEAEVAEAMRLAATGEHAEAERRLEEVAARHPQSAEVHYRLGLLQLRRKSTDEALRSLARAGEIEPGSPLVWLALGQAWLQKGKLDDAVSAIRRAEKLAPRDANVTRAAGILASRVAGAYRDAKNPVKAVELWQEAIRLDPEQAAHYLEAAQLFLDHRTFEPAVVLLDRASAKFPANAEVARFLGLAHYGTGNEERALAAFLRVADLEPDAEASYASLETLIPSAGPRLDEIIERLRGFTARKPASPLGPFLLALAAGLKPGGEERVETLLRQAIQREPRFWPAHFELHKALAASGKTREAVQALDKTVELNPSHAAAHYSLAQLMLSLGDRERAAKERQVHHRLSAEARRAAESRRAETPMLPYSISPR